MQILVTGRGSSGSWKVRGEQLGAAIGARVVPQCTDFDGADIVICVKRVLNPGLLKGKRWLYDIVDAWPQPSGNDWGKAQAVAWLRGELARLKPYAVVFATAVMHEDSGWDGPALVLPHHAWEAQGVCVIGSEVRSVGYQGGLNYLGNWRNVMGQECRRRGWKWVENPPSIAALDIVVAIREQQGYAARNWKSNIKAANAQGCGTPLIANREAGYLETASGGEYWADTHLEMRTALDALTPQRARVIASSKMRAAAPRLSDIAARYKNWLMEIAC
jgi:hypothetical protein